MENIRLIDANALKETINAFYDAHFVGCVSNDLITYAKGVDGFIDNAPTVFDCRSCKNNGNELECVDCHDYSNYVHYEERPQGEWIDEGQYAEGHDEHAYRCKKCGYHIIEKPNMISENRFCRNCGADM